MKNIGYILKAGKSLKEVIWLMLSFLIILLFAGLGKIIGRLLRI